MKGSCSKCKDGFRLSEEGVKTCLVLPEDSKEIAKVIGGFFDKVGLSVEIYFDFKVNVLNIPKEVQGIDKADFLLPDGSLYEIKATQQALVKNKLIFKLELPVDEASQGKITMSVGGAADGGDAGEGPSGEDLGETGSSAGSSKKGNQRDRGDGNGRVLGENKGEGDLELMIVVENVSFYKSEGNSVYKYIGRFVYITGICLSLLTLIFAPPLSFLLFNSISMIWALGFTDPDYPANFRLLINQFSMGFYSALPNPFNSDDNNQKLCEMKPILHSKDQTCDTIQSPSTGIVLLLCCLFVIKVIWSFLKKFLDQKNSSEKGGENKNKKLSISGGELKGRRNSTSSEKLTSAFMIHTKTMIEEEVNDFIFLRRGLFLLLILTTQPQILTQSLITLRYSLRFNTAKNLINTITSILLCIFNLAMLLYVVYFKLKINKILKNLIGNNQKARYSNKIFYKDFYKSMESGAMVSLIFILQNLLTSIMAILVNSAPIQLIVFALLWVGSLIGLILLNPYRSKLVFSAHLTHTACFFLTILLSCFTSNELKIGISERSKSRILSPLLTATLLIPVLYLILVIVLIGFQKMFVYSDQDPEGLKKKGTKRKQHFEFRSGLQLKGDFRVSTKNLDWEMRIPVESKISKEAVKRHKMSSMGWIGSQRFVVTHKEFGAKKNLSSIQKVSHLDGSKDSEGLKKCASIHMFLD